VKKFLQPDIIFLNSNAKSLKIKNSYVDICFSSNFFEHLKSKSELDLVLREALRIMKPGALYICMQPNIRFNYKNYWDFYDHNIPLSDVSCSEAFEKAGFIIEKIIPKFVPFSTKSNYPKSPFLIKIYLLMPIIWKIFGGQFLIFARKPYRLNK
jgi:ubiquinone/menaquinone biosynthesis C-methylase UbiE